MTAPFIFIGTHRIKPGKREEFLRYFTEFCDNVVEPREPQLHSFYGYTAPDSDLVTIVQVHPDSQSMMTHMSVGAEHFVRAYAEFLEPESTMQIYGVPDPALLEAMAAVAQSDPDSESSVVIREPFAGFDRLHLATA